MGYPLFKKNAPSNATPNLISFNNNNNNNNNPKIKFNYIYLFFIVSFFNFFSPSGVLFMKCSKFLPLEDIKNSSTSEFTPVLLVLSNMVYACSKPLLT